MADKLGGVKVSIFSLVVVAITGIIMTLPLGWIPLFICAIVMAVAFGFNNAAVMKLVPVYVSQSVGGASGWIGGLGAFGGFVIPPLMGNIFSNPYLPQVDDYYEPFTFDFSKLQGKKRLKTPPSARPYSLITGEKMEKIEYGPNWEDDLAGPFETRKKDPNMFKISCHPFQAINSKFFK